MIILPGDPPTILDNNSRFEDSGEAGRTRSSEFNSLQIQIQQKQ